MAALNPVSRRELVRKLKRREVTGLAESDNIQMPLTPVPAAPPELLEFTCCDDNNDEVKLLP